MPTWGQLLKEHVPDKDGKVHFDKIRKKYLVKLHQYTERDTIVYATAFTTNKEINDRAALSINSFDRSGFMETLHNMNGDELDLIIHSPGGFAEETDKIVRYIRKKYKHIRAIIPLEAMSAATMLACSADEIIMGKQSYLGPIDPQLVIPGKGLIPAQAIIDEVNRARKEIDDNKNNPLDFQSKLAFWIPMLQSIISIGLLKVCENSIDLAKSLVELWLKSYMFKSDPDRDSKASSIAEFLSNHGNFKSHSKCLNIDDLNDKLIITPLEQDQQLQDLVLSVYHCYDITFSRTGAVKIIENHLGKAKVAVQQQFLLPVESPINPNISPKLTQPQQNKKLKRNRKQRLKR